MKNKLAMLVMACMFALTLAFPVQAIEDSEGVGQWDFDVYLNDKKVGKHKFDVSHSDGVKQVTSEASFQYKIFLISVYRYKHSAAERWVDDCLLGFDASTNANGKRTQIFGEQSGTGFVVDVANEVIELPNCVMTFAYWNPEFLEQSRLLNPQTGEYVDVRVEAVGEEMLQVRGQAVAATRFRLLADEVNVTLWYSLDREWLALKSVVKGGHIIRYELS